MLVRGFGPDQFRFRAAVLGLRWLVWVLRRVRGRTAR